MYGEPVDEERCNIGLDVDEEEDEGKSDVDEGKTDLDEGNFDVDEERNNPWDFIVPCPELPLVLLLFALLDLGICSIYIRIYI